MRSLNTQLYPLIAIIVLTALTGLIGLLIALLKLSEEKRQRHVVRRRERLRARMTAAHAPPKA